jgi:hypothetical protein
LTTARLGPGLNMMIKKPPSRPKLGNKPTLVRLSGETRKRMGKFVSDRGMARSSAKPWRS